MTHPDNCRVGVVYAYDQAATAVRLAGPDLGLWAGSRTVDGTAPDGR